MKRFLFTLLLGIITMGCSETFFEEAAKFPSLSAHKLYIWRTEFSFTNIASEAQLDIVAESTPWSVVNDVDWITFDQTSGNGSLEVLMSVAENKSGDSNRTGLFYVKSGASDFPASVPITVTQTGATPYIKPATLTVTLDSKTPSYTLAVEANCTWEHECDATWLQVARSGDNLVITATEENMRSDTRSASVILRQAGSTSTYYGVTVKQLPSEVTVSTESLSVPADGGVFDFSFSSPANWEIKTDDSYITVQPSSGSAGENSVKVEVAPNTSSTYRNGSFTLYVNGSARNVIKVAQNKYTLSLSQNAIQFYAIGGEEEIVVSGVPSWISMTDADWITLSPASGKDSDPLKIKVAPNTGDYRSEKVYVQVEGTTMQGSISVTQFRNAQDLSRTALSYGSEGGSETITVGNASGWKARTAESWITLSPTESTTTPKLVVTVGANADAAVRTGTIEVTMDDVVETITVVQQGTVLELAGDLEFTSTGGNGTFSLTASGSWELSVEDNADWITPGVTSGEGSRDISIACADNPSTKARSSALLVKNALGKTLRLNVTQAGRYLRLDHTELLFYGNGGTSEAVTIETDGTFTVSSSYMWLRVNTVGKTFTVTCLENEGTQPRDGKVIVALTGLEGDSYAIELPVTQLEPGGSFHRIDYGEDENLDGSSSRQMTVDFTGYGSDVNLDGGSLSTKGTISRLSTSLKAQPNYPKVKEIK